MPTILTYPPIEADEPRARRKRWTRVEIMTHCVTN